VKVEGVTNSRRCETGISFENGTSTSLPPDLGNETSSNLKYFTRGVGSIRVAEGSNKGCYIVGLQMYKTGSQSGKNSYTKVRKHIWRHDGFSHGWSGKLSINYISASALRSPLTYWCNRSWFNVVLRSFTGQCLREANETHLGGTVIGLPEVALHYPRSIRE